MSKVMTYLQEGESLDWSNGTGSDVAYGDVVILGSRIGVALENIANGLVGAVGVCGVFQATAVNDAAFAVGDTLYWDNSAKKLTKVVGANAIAGLCVATKAETATTAKVKLLPNLPPIAVTGAEAGYRVARGVTSVTGTEVIVTGLSTVVAVTAVLAADPSANATIASVSIPTQTGSNAGKFTAKVWKPTAADNSAPIASSTATAVAWIAVGT